MRERGKRSANLYFVKANSIGADGPPPGCLGVGGEGGAGKQCQPGETITEARDLTHSAENKRSGTFRNVTSRC